MYLNFYKYKGESLSLLVVIYFSNEKHISPDKISWILVYFINYIYLFIYLHNLQYILVK